MTKRSVALRATLMLSGLASRANRTPGVASTTDSVVCAVLCLLFFAAVPAHAAGGHPESRLRKTRSAVVTPVAPRSSSGNASAARSASRAQARRVKGQSAQPGPDSAKKPATKAKPAAKSPKAKSPAQSSKPSIRGGAATPGSSAGKSKKHKVRPEEEAEGDPLVIHRTKSKSGKSERVVGSRQIASRRAVAVPSARSTRPEKPAPLVRTTSTDAPVAEAAAARKTLTPADFMRAAGAPAAEAETMERGEAHPDDDERLPVRRPSLTGETASAQVSSAAPDSTLQAVTAPAPAPKRGPTAKAAAPSPALPDDKAAKDEIIEQAMSTPLPALYNRSGHLVVPPPMRGTREILVHQNTMADSEGLDRIRNDADLNRMRSMKLLVPLASTGSLEVNPELPQNRRYARPWAARFAADMASAYYAEFHQPLRLNSAVRTVSYQLRLQRVNGNAAAVAGDAASPHLTGQALDFGKRGMTVAQIAWMRTFLGPLVDAGKLDVEEEFQQACFHISVYKNYLPTGKSVAPKTKAVPRTALAQAKPAPVVRPAESEEQDYK